VADRMTHQQQLRVDGAGLIVALAAQSEYEIEVMRCLLTTDANTTIVFEDEDGVELAGPFIIATNGGFVMPSDQSQWVRCTFEKGLNIRVGGAANVGGVIWWRGNPLQRS